MEATTTLGTITPGEWTAQNILRTTRMGRLPKVVGSGGQLIVEFMGGELEEVEANAEMIADAGTTANKTGKLPSQLLQERDELVKELENILEWHRIETTPLRERELKSIADLIYRVTNPKP